MVMTKKVSLIIPNWNGLDFLKVCLPSLLKQSYQNFGIIIVDNGSTDNSVEFIKKNYPQIKIYQFRENRGFCQAINAGINLASGEYIFLLNNDTEVEVNCLSELVKTANKNTAAGFFATKMIYFDRRDIINDTGDIFSIYGLAHQRGKEEIDQGRYDKEEYVFGACAGATLYRKSMLEEIGLLDEDFFAYLEDIDLSFRAQLAGYKCLYVPTAIVYHVDGGTSKKVDDLPRYHTLRNSLFVITKNLPITLIFLYLPFILLGQVRNFFIGLKHHCLKLILKVYLDYFKELPSLIKKRKEIQKDRVVSNFYLNSIISKKYPFSAIKSFKEMYGGRK